MEVLREKIARQLCAADSNAGFCTCVGESLGCLVGRGEAFNGTNLSGYEATADRILALPEIAEALELRAYAKRWRNPTSEELVRARARWGTREPE